VAREAAENCARYANASVFSDLGRSELGNDHQRSEYISGALSNVGHAAAGIAHGGVDYAVNQCCHVTCIACTIGSDDMDDSWEERRSFQEAFGWSQSAHVDSLSGYIVKRLGVDPNNKVYQNCCSYTTTALEVGSVVAGGYRTSLL